MSALALADANVDWKVIVSSKGNELPYCNEDESTLSYVDFTLPNRKVPEGFGRLADLLDELESDPLLSKELAETRREIAAENISDGNLTLSNFRMAQGLSQSELATLLGTSQAAVSRMEAGHQEPRLSMLRRLADVLKVDLNSIGAAFPS